MRLTIVGGFLGSGKTTWLRHQLHAGRFANCHIVVNEAAGTPVDDALLGAGRALTVLAGGCACCEGQADLRAALLTLSDARSRTAEDRTDQIVLETSGLADPAAIVGMIQSDPILIRQIVVSEVLVVVDALHGAEVLRGEALSSAQIEAADRLILTKTDLARPGNVAQLCKTLAQHAPQAGLSASVFGSEAMLPEVGPDVEPLEILAAGAPPLVAVQLALGDQPDWTALTVWLSCLLHARGDQILRAKGVVKTPAGRLLLQSVRRVVQSPEVLPPEAQAVDNTVVLIGRDLDAPQIAASYHRISPSPEAAANAPPRQSVADQGAVGTPEG